MEFINNQVKIKGDKPIFNKRTILFIAINIGIFIYMINFYDNLLEVNTILRKLEDDPRTKGSNEVCMKIIDNDLYDLFGLENKIYNVTNNIKLRLCDNIDGYKSSCIYKNGDITNNLAGDIKGEENNKNKIEVTNEIVKIYLAAGNKFKNIQRYKVNIEIKCNNSYDFEIEVKELLSVLWFFNKLFMILFSIELLLFVLCTLIRSSFIILTYVNTVVRSSKSGIFSAQLLQNS